jgi:hypothetical protein
MKWFTLRNIGVVLIGIICMAAVSEAFDMINEIGLMRSLPTLLIVLVVAIVIGIFFKKMREAPKLKVNQAELKNEKIRMYSFLQEMYHDSYFPKPLVDKGKDILLELCFKIEQQQPKDLDGLYKLTNAATNEFNRLEHEFEANNSEIETAARDCIGTDFEFIAKAYGYNADTEELIATRNW